MRELTVSGYSVREAAPQPLPTKPPFTAHLGNLSYDATEGAITDFFQDCEVVSVRLIEDRETQRPKGFGYVEFGTLDGLKKALALDGEPFEGRTVRIKVADPRKSFRMVLHARFANISQLVVVTPAGVILSERWATGLARDLFLTHPREEEAVLSLASAVLPVTLHLSKLVPLGI